MSYALSRPIIVHSFCSLHFRTAAAATVPGAYKRTAVGAQRGLMPTQSTIQFRIKNAWRHTIMQRIGGRVARMLERDAGGGAGGREYLSDGTDVATYWQWRFVTRWNHRCTARAIGLLYTDQDIPPPRTFLPLRSCLLVTTTVVLKRKILVNDISVRLGSRSSKE